MRWARILHITEISSANLQNLTNTTFRRGASALNQWTNVRDTWIPLRRSANEPSTKEKGYDRAWKKFRAWFLKRHPLCQDCFGGSCSLFSPRRASHQKRIRDQPELRLVESKQHGAVQQPSPIRSQRGD